MSTWWVPSWVYQQGMGAPKLPPARLRLSDVDALADFMAKRWSPGDIEIYASDGRIRVERFGDDHPDLQPVDLENVMVSYRQHTPAEGDMITAQNGPRYFTIGLSRHHQSSCNFGPNNYADERVFGDQIRDYLLQLARPRYGRWLVWAAVAAIVLAVEIPAVIYLVRGDVPGLLVAFLVAALLVVAGVAVDAARRITDPESRRWVGIVINPRRTGVLRANRDDNLVRIGLAVLGVVVGVVGSWLARR